MDTEDAKSLDAASDDLILWATARAGLIVVVPVLGSTALLANEVYLIVRLGKIYGKKISESAALGFIGGLGATFVGQTLATMIPFPPLQIPIGMGVTYALGRVARSWIADGMPDSAEKYQAAFSSEFSSAKARASDFSSHPNRDKPLGDEARRF
ncbi:hypothetical protein FDZ71_07635 [bacterium]|nr:MAG: hypothetical protein FDZ71_07635 [bacterium]